jgi:AraC family transcriptional regulator
MYDWQEKPVRLVKNPKRLGRYVDSFGPETIKVAEAHVRSYGRFSASVIDVRHVPTPHHDQPAVAELILHIVLEPDASQVVTTIGDVRRVVQPQAGSILVTLPDLPTIWSWTGHPMCRNIGLPMELLLTQTRLTRSELLERLWPLVRAEVQSPELVRLAAQLAALSPEEVMEADAILDQIARLVLLMAGIATGESARRSSLPAWKIVRIVDHIRRNLGAPLTLAELADLVGLSEFHFCRAFRDATGQTPYQRVVQERLAMAEHLLAVSDLSVQEIARQVGFASQAHFTTAFRRQKGEPPARFRRLIKATAAG